jgi:hypothetical protein
MYGGRVNVAMSVAVIIVEDQADRLPVGSGRPLAGWTKPTACGRAAAMSADDKSSAWVNDEK